MELNENRRRTRGYCRENNISTATPEETEREKRKLELENLEKYPFAKFYGDVKYCTTFPEITSACDQLLEDVCNQNENEELFPVGFDMEWPFSFKTGPGKTALIQVCANKRTCYLFHVSKLDLLPKELGIFLLHPKVRLCGVNIRNDIHKLCRDFTQLSKKKEALLNNCVDSRTQAKEVSDRVSWSMEKLVNHFLKMQVDKDKKVRMSQWHVIPLTEAQQKYAAVDAYLSLALYRHLNSLIRRQNALHED